MDLSAKALSNWCMVFMGIFLLIGVLTFSILSSHARGALSSVVEYVEIKGYTAESAQIIEEYAQSSHLLVTVHAVTGEDGIHAAGDRQRYEVEVSFDHIFAVVNLSKHITYRGYTRAVEF